MRNFKHLAKCTPGISLVETLVYIALLNIVILSFWGAYRFYLDQTNRINKESNEGYSNKKIDQSPLTIILSDQSLSMGSTMDLSTYGGSGSGSVIYFSGSQNICTIEGDKLIAVNPGICIISASKADSLRFSQIETNTSLLIKN